MNLNQLWSEHFSPGWMPDRPWRYLLIGGMTGTLSGFFGVGGGIILIPMLVFILHFEQHRAHATSLAAIFIVAGAGLVRFGLAGEVNWWVGLALGIGGLVGSTIGARTMQRLSPMVLRLVFSAVLTVVGVSMIFRSAEYSGEATNGGWTVLLALLIGTISGAISGLIGLGGGVVLVPAMVLLMGIDQHIAQGTALFVMLFSTSAGTRVHLRHHRVRLGDSLILGIGGAIMSPLAGSLALSLEASLLTRLFGGMVVFTGLRMGWGCFRLFQNQRNQTALDRSK